MSKLNLSIGILTWKRLDILRQTLDSYKKNGLLELSDDIRIFFNEIGEEEIALAKEYNLKYSGDKENVGIKEAYKSLANDAIYDNFLFLENDWYLIENANITRQRFEASIALLDDKLADVVRFRHRENPGWPCNIVYRNKKNPLLSPESDLAYTPSILKDPTTVYKQITKKQIGDDVYFFVGAKNSWWTNNPCLLKTKFVKELMSLDLDERGNDKIINKKYNVPYIKISLEGVMTEYWKTSSYITALSPGLFTHLDYIEDFKPHKMYPASLLRFLCFFIPSTKYRKYLRAKYSRR